MANTAVGAHGSFFRLVSGEALPMSVENIKAALLTAGQLMKAGREGRAGEGGRDRGGPKPGPVIHSITLQTEMRRPNVDAASCFSAIS